MAFFPVHPSHYVEVRFLRRWLLVLLACLLGVLWLPTPDEARGLAGYVPLHTTLEILAISIVAMVFGISWTTQRYRTDGRTMLTGVLFLGVGLLDMSHTLSFQGMPDFFTPSSSEKAINFWFAARTLAALSMLWIAFWPTRWNHLLDRIPRVPTLIAILAAVIGSHLVILAWPEVLPQTFIEGVGLTNFKQTYEFALIFAYLLAGFGFLRRLKHKRTFGAALLAATALTMAISEFFFTLYANVTDIYNLLGHIYKLLAYGSLYQALFVDSVQSPFLDLKAAQARQNAMLEALPDILFEVDGEGVCHAVYTAEPGKLAAEPSEIVGRRINDILPSAAALSSMEALEEARAYGISRGIRIKLDVPAGLSYFELSVAWGPQLLSGQEGFLVLSRDVTATVMQEEQIRFEAEVNAALLSLQDLLSESSEEEMLRVTLEYAMRLTGSKLAFIHSVSEDGNETDLVSWLAEKTFSSADRQQPPSWCTDKTAMWARSLHQSEPVVCNAYDPTPGTSSAANQRQQNLDAPHRLVSVQALDAKRVCMILVVADRDSPYTESMVQAIRMLGSEVCGLVKRKRQDERIHLLSTSLDQSPYPVVITNAGVHLEYVNQAFSKLSGYAPSDVLGQNPRMLQSGQTPLSTYREMWARLTQGLPWEGEFINRRKDRSTYVERALVYPIHDNTGRVSHYVAHKEDVTSRKLAEERIRELSSFDGLTGLLNKRAFEIQLSNALAQDTAQPEQVAMLWFDLDNFRAVNDSLGRSAGDELLLECSKRLRRVFAPPTVLGRYAGDIFVALVSGADQAALALLAQDAMRELQRSIRIRGSSVILTASVGISIYPDDAASPSLLTTAAESAMRRVKEEGRNGFRFFAPDMQAHSQRSLELAADLRLAAERGELHLVYQPQYSLRDNSLAGAEALLRWTHPKWGKLSPAEFIPLAERTGAIVEIGQWVMDQAVRQWRNWHDSGLHVKFVAINVSAIQFAQPDLFDQLTSVIRKYGVEPSRLEIELTEAVAVRDPMGVGGKIRQLHETGFRVSIDDFGTGYSSMSYLKRYSLNKLKIDQSFIRDLSTDDGDLAIVTAIVKMAHALGLSAIAEGVETREQMDLLRLAGCDEIQGYVFARPLPPDEFETFARQLSARTDAEHDSAKAGTFGAVDTASPIPPSH